MNTIIHVIECFGFALVAYEVAEKTCTLHIHRLKRHNHKPGGFMNRKHIVIPSKAFDLISADSEKTGRSMYQIAGDIISCHYSGNSGVNTAVAEGRTLTENVNTMSASKNSEIGSKTPFSAQNGEKSAPFCPKGEGDFGLNCTNTNNDAISKDNSKVKLNKINKEESSKKGRLPPKEYWKNLEKELEPYWIVYPEMGRVEWETCKKVFHRMRKSKHIPEVADFYGIVRHFYEKIWRNVMPSNPDYAPKLAKFLNDADWLKMSKSDVSEIVRNRENNKRTVELLVERFNGSSTRITENTMTNYHSRITSQQEEKQ